MEDIYNKLKKSDRKFIRLEKARIRRQFWDEKKQEEMITELYKKFLGNAIVKEVVQEIKKPEVKIARAQKPKVKKSKTKAKK